MAGLPSFIKSGKEGIERTGSGIYISLKDGDTIEIVPVTGVDQIISFDQHALWRDEGNSPIFPCIKTKDCPGCLLENDAKFRALMQVIVRDKDSGERQRKILPIGMSLMKQMVEIEEAIGDTMQGGVLRVSRKGTGLNTRYTATFTGRRAEITEDDVMPDEEMLELVGPTTADEIIAVLKEAGMWPPKSKKKAVAPAGKGKKADDWAEEEFVDEA